MEYHKETDILINEIANIELKLNSNKVLLSCIDRNIGRSRFNCLLMFYGYPECGVVENNSEDDVKQYDITKRQSQNMMKRGILYKYVYKSIENDNIQTIFYYENSSKLCSFQSIVKEPEFKTLFDSYIRNIRISKDSLEIYFNNDSRIIFKLANDGSRGFRYHFAIVDTDITYDLFRDVISAKGVLFDMVKKEALLKYNYNIEFIEM